MTTRTYNPSVRVGNWNEDIQLEEATLKEFLERRERGELLTQKSSSMTQSLNASSSLSIARDGKVHFGDTVMLVNPETSERKATSLSAGNEATAGMSTQPTLRNTFVITSIDGTPNGEQLRYGQAFYLVSGEKKLFSDRATFAKSAKKSRHNPVSMVSEGSHLTEWRVVAFDPQYRMELEHCDVPANTKVIINHVKTNQNLCLEENFTSRTALGREFEVSSFTSLDSHKAENNTNHWKIVMNVPGE